MLLDDVPGDRQPETRAAAADADPVDLVEPLEDPGLVGLRDADPVVLDRQRRPRRRTPNVTRTSDGAAVAATASVVARPGG